MYSVAAALVFVFTSWLVLEIKDHAYFARFPHLRTLATIYAEGLGIAQGWTTFNMINVMFKCNFSGVLWGSAH